MARRGHTKSRRGCAECKRRHIKCDESRPECANCSISQRRCCYLVGSATHTAVASSEPPSGSRPPPLPPPAPPFTLAGHQDPSSINMGHLSLLSHLLLKTLPDIDPLGQNRALTQHLVGCAATTPYLMQEFLAVGALHCAHLHRQAAAGDNPCQGGNENNFPVPNSDPEVPATHHEQAVAFRMQATDLRTQAVELFNTAEKNIGPSNCLPMMLFTSLLGLHSLADAAAGVAEDVAENFVELFVDYLDIHRGVKIVTAACYQFLKASALNQILEHAEWALSTPESAQHTHEYDRLQTLLDSVSDLKTESLTACREAVEVLDKIIGFQGSSHTESSASAAGTPLTCAARSDQSLGTSPVYTGRSDASSVAVPPPTTGLSGPIFAWPVLMSAEFVRLLRQRRPEALIILAYFAVVLHRERHTWIIGGSGRILIKQITHYLGSFWWEWLEWPNEALSM